MDASRTLPIRDREDIVQGRGQVVPWKEIAALGPETGLTPQHYFALIALDRDTLVTPDNWHEKRPLSMGVF